MLRICDRYPHRVPVKGAFIQFMAKTLCIISNSPVDQWYKFDKFDPAALMRRVNVYKMWNGANDTFEELKDTPAYNPTLPERTLSSEGTVLRSLCAYLKEDSKSLIKEYLLAGTASDTAAWVTNVGDEYGQVLISVLTCSEGLSSMAAGLMRRYRLAGVPPPQLIYVDRDCCNRDGVSKTAALFQEWGQLVVRLDIWHLMLRFTAGVTTESHELYPAFMRQLSLCIFEVDPGDARCLTEAKRSKMEVKHAMVALTDTEVIRRISR
ncbi:hypothetical protein JOQ06_004032 [Pogonophryne albipinna]|uniref:Uncharacterized protein n=1 Tax=Pogonophryne albipinna TaxID=1090488 RepID=A0AAD6ABV9_9TELE|nr:hypothetical protein JOQ06_004032 [Pogonophryne albipinna]